MANAFDQFDTAVAPTAPNPFDQFGGGVSTAPQSAGIDAAARASGAAQALLPKTQNAQQIKVRDASAPGGYRYAPAPSDYSGAVAATRRLLKDPEYGASGHFDFTPSDDTPEQPFSNPAEETAVRAELPKIQAKLIAYRNRPDRLALAGEQVDTAIGQMFDKRPGVPLDTEAKLPFTTRLLSSFEHDPDKQIAQLKLQNGIINARRNITGDNIIVTIPDAEHGQRDVYLHPINSHFYSPSSWDIAGSLPGLAKGAAVGAALMAAGPEVGLARLAGVGAGAGAATELAAPVLPRYLSGAPASELVTASDIPQAAQGAVGGALAPVLAAGATPVLSAANRLLQTERLFGVNPAIRAEMQTAQGQVGNRAPIGQATGSDYLSRAANSVGSGAKARAAEDAASLRAALRPNADYSPLASGTELAQAAKPILAGAAEKSAAGVEAAQKEAQSALQAHTGDVGSALTPVETGNAVINQLQSIKQKAGDDFAAGFNQLLADTGNPDISYDALREYRKSLVKSYGELKGDPRRIVKNALDYIDRLTGDKAAAGGAATAETTPEAALLADAGAPTEKQVPLNVEQAINTRRAIDSEIDFDKLPINGKPLSVGLREALNADAENALEKAAPGAGKTFRDLNKAYSEAADRVDNARIRNAMLDPSTGQNLSPEGLVRSISSGNYDAYKAISDALGPNSPQLGALNRQAAQSIIRNATNSLTGDIDASALAAAVDRLNAEHPEVAKAIFSSGGNGPLAPQTLVAAAKAVSAAGGKELPAREFEAALAASPQDVAAAARAAVAAAKQHAAEFDTAAMKYLRDGGAAPGDPGDWLRKLGNESAANVDATLARLPEKLQTDIRNRAMQNVLDDAGRSLRSPGEAAGQNPRFSYDRLNAVLSEDKNDGLRRLLGDENLDTLTGLRRQALAREKEDAALGVKETHAPENVAKDVATTAISGGRGARSEANLAVRAAKSLLAAPTGLALRASPAFENYLRTGVFEVPRSAAATGILAAGGASAVDAAKRTLLSQIAPSTLAPSVTSAQSSPLSGAR